MKQLITTFFAALLLSISSFIAIAQEEEGYKFEVIKEIKTSNEREPAGALQQHHFLKRRL